MAVLVGTKSKQKAINITISTVIGKISHTVYLSEVAPIIPGEVCCEEFDTLINPTQPSELWSIGVQDDLVGSSFFNPDSVICKAVLLRPGSSQ